MKYFFMFALAINAKCRVCHHRKHSHWLLIILSRKKIDELSALPDCCMLYMKYNDRIYFTKRSEVRQVQAIGLNSHVVEIMDWPDCHIFPSNIFIEGFVNPNKSDIGEKTPTFEQHDFTP